MIHTHRRGRLMLAGLLVALTLLAVGVIVLILAGSDTNGEPDRDPQAVTISPFYADPRLSITLAYPFRGASGLGSATSLPIDALPGEIQRDYTGTPGVLGCDVAMADRGMAGVAKITATCRVDPGHNVIEMAELLRLLADRQYYQIAVDLTLDDGATPTRYVWENPESGWQIDP